MKDFANVQTVLKCNQENYKPHLNYLWSAHSCISTIAHLGRVGALTRIYLAYRLEKIDLPQILITFS